MIKEKENDIVLLKAQVNDAKIFKAQVQQVQDALVAEYKKTLNVCLNVFSLSISFL
jgi:hypothetical protein